MGAGASQQGCARGGWHHDPTDHDVRPRRGGIPGRDSGNATDENLPAGGGAARLHSKGEWEAEAVGHTDGTRPGSTNGDPDDPGADFRGRLPGLLVWVPAGAISAPGAGGATRSFAGRVSSGVRRGPERLFRFDSALTTASVRARPGGRSVGP